MRFNPLRSGDNLALLVHMSREGLGTIAGETGLRQHFNSGRVADVIFGEHARPELRPVLAERTRGLRPLRTGLIESATIRSGVLPDFFIRETIREKNLNFTNAKETPRRNHWRLDI